MSSAPFTRIINLEKVPQKKKTEQQQQKNRPLFAFPSHLDIHQKRPRRHGNTE